MDDIQVRVYSQDFTEEKDPFHILVEESIWRQVYRDMEEGGRIFLRLFKEGVDWISPMGGFVKAFNPDEDSAKSVYLPIWMLDAMGLQGQGETVTCSILTNDAFPEATKIKLRVVDSAFYNGDVKVELEQALSRLGILKKHTTIQIPVQALGNYPVELFVSDLEPADCVLCDGEEVAVEFEEPVDHYEPPLAAAMPTQPTRPPTPIPADIPRLPEPMVQNETPPARAFQGQGHRLGGSNDCIPEWRRNLPPPRRP